MSTSSTAAPTRYLTTTEQASLTQLYVAILGGQPSKASLTSYANIYLASKPGDYTAVATSLVNTSQGQEYYGPFSSVKDVAAKLLSNLGLNGDALGGETGATKLSAFVETVLSSYNVATVATVLCNALNSGTFTGSDGWSQTAKSAQADYGVQSGVAGAKLKPIIDAALSPIPASPTSFGTAADDLMGGSGNDTFAGYILATGSTIQTGDKVSGGAGTDTVSITNNSNTSVTLELKDVEQVSMKLIESGTLDAVLWSGLSKVSTDASSLNGKSLTVNNAKSSGITYEMNHNGNLSVTFIDATGSSDSVAVTLASPSASTVNLGNGIETITLTTTGTSTADVTLNTNAGSGSLTIVGTQGVKQVISTDIVGTISLTGGSNNTLSLTGTGNHSVTLGNATSGTTVAISVEGNNTVSGGNGADTINLLGGLSGAVSISGNDGNDTIAVTRNGPSTVDGGAGADTITFGVGTFGSGDIVRGGDGNDRLSISLGAGLTKPSEISSIETLSVTFTSTASLNLANAEGITSILHGASTVTSAAFTNAPLSVTTLSSVHALKTNSAGYRSNADATLTISGSGATTAVQTVDEVKTLTVSITATASGTQSIVTDEETESVSVSLIGEGANLLISGDLGALTTASVTLIGGDATVAIGANIGSASGTNVSTMASGGLLALTVAEFTNSGAGMMTIRPIFADYGAPSSLTTLRFTQASGSGDISFGNQTDTLSALESLRITAGSGGVTLGTIAAGNALSEINVSVGNGTATVGNITNSTLLTNVVLTAGQSGVISMAGVSASGIAAVLQDITISAGSAATVTIGSLSVTNHVERLTVTGGSAATVGVSGIGGGNGTIGGVAVVNAAGLIDSTFTFGSASAVLATQVAMSITGGRSSTNVLSGGGGADSIYGSSKTDNVMGGSGADVISLGLDHDTVDGGAGSDTITTGTGNDRISYFLSGGGRDYITDLSTTDIISLRHEVSGSENLEFTAAATSIVNGGSQAQVLLRGSGEGDINIYEFRVSGDSVSGLTADQLYNKYFSSASTLIDSVLVSVSGKMVLGGSTASQAAAVVVIVGDDAAQVLLVNASTGTTQLSTSDISIILTLNGATGYVVGNVS